VLSPHFLNRLGDETVALGVVDQKGQNAQSGSAGETGSREQLARSSCVVGKLVRHGCFEENGRHKAPRRKLASAQNLSDEPLTIDRQGKR